MKEHLLVVDVGNTSTSIGLCAGGRVTWRQQLPSARAARAPIESALRSVTKGRAVAGAVLASVVPRLDRTWLSAIRRACGIRALKVTYRLKLGVPVTYPKPWTIGADRLANACAAAHKYGTPVIVADFGTALTFDVILPRHGYVGGIIAPGLPLMFDYLAEKTALLPHIGPGKLRHKVGKSTIEAIRMGSKWGYQGMVREILAQLKSTMRGHVTICATGGYAGWVLHGFRPRVVQDPDLTLRGLGRIWELNR